MHVPFAQAPEHSLSAAQSTWHGDAPHENSQELPSPHLQSPFAQTPLQDELSPSQSTWHGGASHSSSHDAPAGQAQLPSTHSAPPQLKRTTSNVANPHPKSQRMRAS